MSSSQSNIRAFWERCIGETMFLRNHCIIRPLLYYTESGTLVLDALTVNPADTTVINAIAVICDLIAGECGYRQNCATGSGAIYVWQKGGDV